MYNTKKYFDFLQAELNSHLSLRKNFATDTKAPMGIGDELYYYICGLVLSRVNVSVQGFKVQRLGVRSNRNH